jgi:hypothetical protein
LRIRSSADCTIDTHESKFSEATGAVPEFMLRSERKFLNDFAGIVQAKDIGLRGYPSFAGSMNDRGSHEHHISAKL